MVILDVIPLTPLPRNHPPTVSYFHTEPLERGTVVQVLFNNRKIKSVVISTSDVAIRKAALKKQATFTLKKIDKILKNKVSEEQIKKAQELSEYYFVHLGVCMRAVILHPNEKNYKKYLTSGPYLDLDDVPLENTGNIKLIDMRKELRDANFSIFSRTLKEALQTYDKIIIFIPRKGYANFLLCKNCGNSIRCPNCSVSLTVHQLSGGTAQLRCHHCNYQQLKPKTCPTCNSYNLKPYGIGIDKVEAELKKFFSYQNLQVPKIEKLTAETPRSPLTIRGDAGGILLATQAIFRHRVLSPMHYPLLAIMNADALVHIPDYRAEEMLLRQTLALASMAERIIVQTYNSEDPALVAAANDKIKEFWERELEQRKKFGYPPFVRLVKLTSRNKNGEMLRRNALALAKQLGGTAYPALIGRERGLYVWHILIKIKNDELQIKNELLRQVPSDWTIDVDSR